ncbi:hypothetical protein LQW54_006167 [Pestalotiopsis sp. IQ-011]
MSKRTTFTTISPLPADIGRQPVLDFLHSHEGMIDLNPLVIERHPLSEPPPHCPDEERECTWWSMTDKITYMPGVKSDLTYTAAFQDLHDGIRTHCYAPMGTHIRERWSLGGTLPGEPKQPVELGIGAPSQGLYIREDVEVRCNFLMAGFVKKTILKSHGVLVERLVAGARKQAESSLQSGSSSALHQHQHQHQQQRPPLSPSSTMFYDDAYQFGAPSDGAARASSVHDEHRKYSGDGSGASSGRSSPPPTMNQNYQSNHQYLPQQQQSQQQSQQQYRLSGQNHQGGGGHTQSFYGHQIAAASESGLAPEPLRTGRSSGQFSGQQQQQQQHSRQESGQIYNGLGWQGPEPKPYVHDPHSPNAQQLQLHQQPQQQYQSTQHRQSSGPIAELVGSETHINELQ